MAAQNPQEFVAALKKNGADDQSVITILRGAGWPEKEAVAALASFYETLTGLSVPAHSRSIGGPREAFLHLLSFLTLSVWCIAAGSLWFTLIAYWFPDPVERYYGDPLVQMAWDLAAVLVAFPVFVLVMRRVWGEVTAQPGQADSAIRRWLTYLALLVAAGTVIGDIVAFVEHLLRGAITAPFAAKVAVVLVLAGGVFWFYLGTVQSGGESRTERLRLYGRMGLIAASCVVALTLVCAFARFGSPAAHRLSTADERRSEDLEAIAVVVQGRWLSAKGDQPPILPQSIRDLPESASLRLTDPISGEAYRYTPMEGMRYQLCATFQTDTTNTTVQQRRGRFRVHPAGDYCFAVDAPAGAK
ncbi:MAG TPA: DUF5671 domain-containing protein [Bryobacteraceae bacterium]|nr:DUF5671 domain-containing protein [Bryobacteraceae bacterium]HPT25460.1 DUF5671 domain-containing protein [Bryobacteraceae bacterium]